MLLEAAVKASILDCSAMLDDTVQVAPPTIANSRSGMYSSMVWVCRCASGESANTSAAIRLPRVNTTRKLAMSNSIISSITQARWVMSHAGVALRKVM